MTTPLKRLTPPGQEPNHQFVTRLRLKRNVVLHKTLIRGEKPWGVFPLLEGRSSRLSNAGLVNWVHWLPCVIHSSWHSVIGRREVP